MRVSNQVHGGSADKILESVKVMGIGRPKPEFEEHYKSFLVNVLTTAYKFSLQILSYPTQSTQRWCGTHTGEMCQ